MADTRISDLNSLGSPDDNDLIPVVDVSEVLPSNQNKKFSFVALKNYVLTALTTPLHKNTHVIGGTDAFLVTDLLNAVAKVGIRITNILIGQRRHINFIAGTNVTITALDDNINEKVDVTINSTVAGNVGDVTGGLNVGTGEGIFLDKVTNDLRFKTARGTGIVTVTTNVNNELEINVPALGNTVDVIQNVGTGEGIWKQTVGNVHDLKSLEGSPSVTITNNSNDLTFTANDLTTISHIGGGLQIASKTLLNTEYNTFSAGTNISIVPTGGNYVINTTAQPNDGLNLGAGQQVFKAVNAGIPEYRTLTSGTGITLSSNANEVNVVNSLPMISGNFLLTTIGSTLIQGVNDLANTGGRFSLINPEYTSNSALFLNQDFYLNGNYNKINFGAVSFFSGNSQNVHIENTIFETNTPTTSIFVFNNQKVIFKNCEFRFVASSSGYPLQFTDCDILFENCVFYAKGTATSPYYIQIIGVNPQTIVFRNNVFFKDTLASVTETLNSATLRNIQFLGDNYSTVANNANITPLIGTLTVDPTLTYIT